MDDDDDDLPNLLSDCDPITDGPIVDFYTELKRLDNEDVRLDSSSLFLQLNANVASSVPQDFNHRPEAIQRLKNFYLPRKFDISSEQSIYANHYDQEIFIEIWSVLKDSSAKSREIGTSRRDLRKFCNEGFLHCETLVMHLTFLRFHEKFRLPRFLYYQLNMGSSVDLETILQPNIERLMFLSRINSVLNGAYLPIVVSVNSTIHATITLVLLENNVQTNETTLRFIQIDSAFDTDDDDNDEMDAIFKSASSFFGFALESQKCGPVKSEIFHCMNDIQKKYGTCASWSIFIAFQILSGIHVLTQQSTLPCLDAIHIFCDTLASETENRETMYKFLEYVKDLTLLFKIYFHQIVDKLVKSGQILIDKEDVTRQKIITTTEENVDPVEEENSESDNVRENSESDNGRENPESDNGREDSESDNGRENSESDDEGNSESDDEENSESDDEENHDDESESDGEYVEEVDSDEKKERKFQAFHAIWNEVLHGPTHETVAIDAEILHRAQSHLNQIMMSDPIQVSIIQKLNNCIQEWTDKIQTSENVEEIATFQKMKTKLENSLTVALQERAARQRQKRENDVGPMKTTKRIKTTEKTTTTKSAKRTRSSPNHQKPDQNRDSPIL